MIPLGVYLGSLYRHSTLGFTKINRVSSGLHAEAMWSFLLPLSWRISWYPYSPFSCSRSTTRSTFGSRRCRSVSVRVLPSTRASPDLADHAFFFASSSRSPSSSSRRRRITGASPSTTSRAGADHRNLHCREPEVKPPPFSPIQSASAVWQRGPWPRLRHPDVSPTSAPGQRPQPSQSGFKSIQIEFKCQNYSQTL